MDIKQAGFSNRTLNCLKRAGILSIEDLLSTPMEEIRATRNAGAKTIQEIEDFKNKFFEKNGEITYVPKTVINKAKPETYEQKKIIIKYRNLFGEYCENIKIDDLKFSARTTHSLSRAGYTTIRDVATVYYSDFISSDGIGASIVEEIIDYLSMNTLIETDKRQLEKYNYYYSWFKNRYGYSEDIFPNSLLTKAIKENIENYLDENEKLDESSISIILKQDNVYKTLKLFISNKINQEKRVSIDDIKEIIPSIFWELEIVDDIIKGLIDNNEIENYKGCLREKLPSIDDWINSLDEKYQTIINMKLEGFTLEECGEVIGVTRERIRQIIQREYKKRPVLREDDYAYWFEKYWFTVDSFSKIFEVDSKVFSYLNQAYRRGSTDIEEMTWDQNMDSEIYSRLLGFLNRKKVIIDGDYVDIKREAICRKLAEVYFSEEETSFDDFYNLYIEFLEENGLDEDERLSFPSSRAFEARIADSRYVLQKYGRKFRYYPIEEYDVNGLVQELHFERLNNVEISTRKLFFENEELMQDYNLQDEYELHNLLKKTMSEWHRVTGFGVKLTRMPLLTIGTVDRYKQAKELLYQIAPVTVEEYAEFYESEYGMLPQTVIANVAPMLEEYYHNGVFDINQAILTDSEIRLVKAELKKDFYFTEDLKKIFLSLTDGDSSKFNARTVKQLGFKVYANYVISSRFNNSYDYFSSILLANNSVDFRELEDGKLSYVQAAARVLDDYRKDYTLLEYEDMKFIKFERVNSVHPEITKDYLKSYAEDAINYDKDKYFTIQSLKKKGFVSSLHNIGLGDWFFACLIRNHESVRFIKTGGNIVFRRGHRPITTVDFMRFILKQKIHMNIYDFIRYIDVEYGVKLEKEKIVYTLKDTDLYYDEIMEKVYLNKDYYYEEV